MNANLPQQKSDEPDKLYKKLEIELKGIDPAVLKSYTWFATNAAQNLGIETGKWYIYISCITTTIVLTSNIVAGLLVNPIRID